MKVGIISMQRVVNCGSFLQAYGLKKMIESIGCEVIFVDYKVGKPVFKDKSDRVIYIKNKLKNTVLNILCLFPFLASVYPLEIKYSVLERNNYKRKYFPILGLKKNKEYHIPVDTIVIGSDEVFNCMQLNPDVGFSPELFGANCKAKKVITYAASFGNTTYDEIEECGKDTELKTYFSKISSLSARDDNTSQIIKKLSSKNISHNLDPVLMYGYKDEIPNIDISYNYILVYAYRRRITEQEAKEIKRIALEMNLKVISVGGYQPFCDENILASPFEVLGFFRKADYVFTDTFHGTIFSVINQKQFVVFVRDGHGKKYGNCEKMDSLLNDLQLLDRKAKEVSGLKDLIMTPIDYEKVNMILENERINATEYLKKNL